MTAHTKLKIAGGLTSIMMMLNVLSKPLHIPEPLQWLVIMGAFVPIALVFRYAKLLKAQGEYPKPIPAQAQKRLYWIIGGCIAIGFSSPFWMPSVGPDLGFATNLFIGVFSAAITCLICWLTMRKQINS